ncbi:hypothetical protein NL676_024333 [Syzygium grande]|nr:hypothetical protein NL676_024333 [Syzygium grande]
MGIADAPPPQPLARACRGIASSLRDLRAIVTSAELSQLAPRDHSTIWTVQGSSFEGTAFGTRGDRGPHHQPGPIRLLLPIFSSASSFFGSRSPNPANYMVEGDFELPTAFDPFAEGKDSGAPGAKEYVHIRIQQRNGKKSLTTVQGLKKEFSYEKILKDLKKEFCCNGNVVQDKELGKIIQLQGDQRKNVSHFLVQAGLVKKDQIKIHGF